MKIGTKMHLDVKLVGSHGKSMSKSFQWDFCFRSLPLLVKKKVSNFALRIHK